MKLVFRLRNDHNGFKLFHLWHEDGSVPSWMAMHYWETLSNKEARIDYYTQFLKAAKMFKNYSNFIFILKDILPYYGHSNLSDLIFEHIYHTNMDPADFLCSRYIREYEDNFWESNRDIQMKLPLY